MGRQTAIPLSLTSDQLDDLVSALEAHRDGFKKLAAEASVGFGLDSTYWQGRVDDVQNLLDTVHRLVGEDDLGSRTAGYEES